MAVTAVGLIVLSTASSLGTDVILLILIASRRVVLKNDTLVSANHIERCQLPVDSHLTTTRTVLLQDRLRRVASVHRL